MKNVLVIFGGKSCEHDVSVITGVMTLNAIDKSQYNPIAIYVDKNGKWYTGKNLDDVSVYKNIDYKKLTSVALFPTDNNLYLIKKNKIKGHCQVYCAVNCCHGGFGEGGGIYALVRQSAIACVSSDLFASSLSMDKEFTKLLLKSISIKCLPCVKITDKSFYSKREKAIQIVEENVEYPVIVKPATLGSSIGISVAKNRNELEKSLINAFTYCSKAVVERAVENFREINCAVYKSGGNVKISELEEPCVQGEMLTFDDKYRLSTPKEFPANVDSQKSLKIKGIAKSIYKRFGFSGVIRIDFLLFKDEIYVNEINSIPGSLAYYLFCKDTKDFGKFLTELIQESVCDYLAENQKVTSFKSGVLNLSSNKLKG